MSDPKSKLEKRVVVITGASGGLGQALCRSFLQGDDDIGIHVRSNISKGEAIIRSFTVAGKKAALRHSDLDDSTSTREMFSHFLKKWNRIDILINNAGVIDDHLFARLNEAAWDRIIRINLTGIFYCMREAGQIMRDQGGGHIINIASLSAFTGRIGQAAYAASKRGLIALTTSAAKEWGASAVQVNAVLPGFLNTQMTTSLTEEQKRKLIGENVLNRPSTLEEVSDFIFYLSKMKYVSGQVFNLDSRIH
jgi:3-oxoacyl-[acyl-carrier protein] reductase